MSSSKQIVTCPQCHQATAHTKDTMLVCPHCDYHFRVPVRERIAQLIDEGSFQELWPHLYSGDPLEMKGYPEKLEASKQKTDIQDAVVTGKCTIGGKSALLGVMAFEFMGGSMGSVVGEKIARLMMEGADTDTPVILVTASGGARMQEGILSLFQMAKTSNAAALMDELGVPLFIVLTHPTTGGVTASFAMLGDVILAEPKALIGFAGPRVIQGTIREDLPEGFQKSEFQQEKGFVDIVVHRHNLRGKLQFLLRTH